MTLWVTNARGAAVVLSHPDPSLTPFLELQFPAGALESLSGQSLGPDDSVQVSVVPRSGVYGFSLSPTGLTFAGGARPSGTFVFARYGDFSVADGSATYPDRDAYADALDVWEEVTVDRWTVAPGSGATGLDEVSAALPAGGDFLLAAPR